MEKFKWAIVGTGYIANQFAQGMREVENAEIAAVVSRSMESGRRYAQAYRGGAVYTDFDEMLSREDVDAVYVAVPNDCHYACIMAALEKGVPVLSEKPMVDNVRQLEAVLSKAEEKGLFLMEGMWTRCFPAVIQARKWIAEGRIGRPLTVRAAFDIQPDMDDWQPWKGGIRHAGGALRDVGIYSLAMAHMVFPESPQHVFTNMKSNGEVDESFQMLIAYEGGRTALLSGAFNQISDHKVEIVGEAGRIAIGPEFWHPWLAELTLRDGAVERFAQKYPETGFQYEIRAVQDCIRSGQRECAHFTHEESRRIGALIEETRKGWGIVYGADRAE